jgi:dipeptidyl-peptidase-4
MSLASCLSILALMQTPPFVANDLLTVAELSDYTATASSEEVIELIGRIAAKSSIMRTGEMGRTSEIKPIPLIFLANPPLASIEEAVRSGKPQCFIMANIHAGEVEGKEACLMLARELALDPDHPLLKDLIIVLAPNFNADGNDHFDTVEKNRPGQDGPRLVGVRPNAQGLDLNRDYIKLEAPESRALVKLLNDLDPHITIDCHTTNGSAHRYVLTYDAPLNPSGHPAPIDFVRHQLLPDVTRRIKDRTGYEMWFYGNFNKDRTTWATYSAEPRFGGPYMGLRGQMSVLSEAYSYAPYKDRVIATREFIREILVFVAAHKQEILDIHAQARRETTDAGSNPQPSDLVGVRHRIAAFNELVMVKGYEDVDGGEGGAAIVDAHKQQGPPKDYSCIHLGRFEPMLSVPRPLGYIIPPGCDRIVDVLLRHGIRTEPFEGEATVEAYTIREIERAEREFQGHRTVALKATATTANRSFTKGSTLVRTAQPLGTLAIYLLEPMSEDGLVTWNFFDDALEIGREFPVVRVRTLEDRREAAPGSRGRDGVNSEGP